MIEQRPYSPLYDSAAMAISSNGFKILKEFKYSSRISKTIVYTLKNGIVFIQYLDDNDKIVAENNGGMRDWYPMIGTVIEKEYSR